MVSFLVKKLASKWDRVGLPQGNLAGSAGFIAWLTVLSELF